MAATTQQRKSIYDFNVGDVLKMRASRGKTVHVKVVGHGRTRLKVAQLESDGRHPVGTQWSMKPGTRTEAVPPEAIPDHVLAAMDMEGEARAAREAERNATMNRFRPGDRVEFTARGGRLLVGSVLKVNRKTVSVQTDDQSSDQWWNVSPAVLRMSNVPKPDRIEVEVEGERMAPADGNPISDTMARSMGNKVTIRYGRGRTHTFTAGGRDRYPHDKGESGIVAVNGRVRLADGSEYYAILDIGEKDSGEHWGTVLFLPAGGITAQDDDDFLQKLGKTAEEVFPYRYKYDATVHCHDHHVGDDGWSVV